MTQTNRQVILTRRPEGIPQASDFRVVAGQRPTLGEGEVLVRNEVLSVEPAMRGWVSAESNYSAPVGIGEVMRSLAVGVIEESRSETYAVGQRVVGWFGWQEWAAVGDRAVQRVVPDNGLPPSTALGVLGLTGATAWLALDALADLRRGQTVVVSTAAGSVGSVVGQLAKHAGCRTVGIVGGSEKARICREEFGYDEAVDYRSPTFTEEIAAACPDGVNLYFDNTCGPISDRVMELLALHARVIVCGTAAVPTWEPWPIGPRVHRHLLTKRARMEGFLFFDHLDRLDDALEALTSLVREGELRYREDIRDGLEAAPDSIASLYRGENLGKLLLRLG